LKTLSLHGKPKKINLVNYNPDAICFTEDPEPLKSYIKQVQCWFSWRPSVRKHFKEVRKRLKFTILWVIGESFGSLLYLGVIIYLLATLQLRLAFLMLGFDALILSIATYIEARKISTFKQAILGLVRCFFIRYINVFLFFKALIKPDQEMVMFIQALSYVTRIAINGIFCP
jgi:hypothetical protein